MKIKKRPSLKTLRKKADKIFSEWRRRKDAVNGRVKCYTCSVAHPRQKMDCGHFLSRTLLAVRYSEDNTRPQDKYCNLFRHGEQYIFGKNLEAEGVDTKKLLRESKKKVKDPRQLYEDVIEKYTKKLQDLNEGK